MNITGITNHMRFEEIFSKARKDGRIVWRDIASMENLPSRFIDHYFCMLKQYGIEKKQKLDDDIIEKHADSLNWFSLLKCQTLSEKTIAANVARIDRMGLWYLLVKTQNLSLQFMIDNLDKLKACKNISDALYYNTSIDESVKEKIKSLLAN